jgi:hypothetical protein
MKNILFFFAFIFCFTIAEDIICQSYVQNYFDAEGREYTFGINPSTAMLYAHDAGAPPNEYKPTNWVFTELAGIAKATSRIDKTEYTLIWDEQRLVISSPEYGTQELSTDYCNYGACFPQIGTTPYGYIVTLHSEFYMVQCPNEAPFLSGQLEEAGRNAQGSYYGIDQYGDTVVFVRPDGEAGYVNE